MITIDKIIRSNRKTVAIIVEPDGKITVRAPLRLSRSSIEQFVVEKANWITSRQEHLQKTQHLAAPHQYQAGEKFYFLGKPYILQLVDRTRPVLQFSDGIFQLAVKAQSRAAEVFEDWYRVEARAYITGRVQALASLHHCTVKSVRITSAKTRWGSCGADGSLNFTWRLIMASEAAIDYVIIHELAHLRIRNHSPQFWETVAEWYPDYPKQRRWLKSNAWLLN